MARMLSKPMAASCLSLALVSVCGCSSTKVSAEESTATASSPAQNVISATNVATHQIFDPSFNLVAGAYNYPAGWQAQSQVVWNIEHFTQPLALHSVAASPDGISALEFFPTEQFCWLVPNPGFKTPGQPMGDGATFLPPVSATDAMVHFEIPKLRGKATDLKIVEVVPMPQLAQSLKVAQPAGSTQESVCARITYQLNGQPVEEEIYGIKTAFPAGVSSFGGAGRMTQYNWGFSTLFSFRTPAGQMEAARPQFVAMVQSFKPNPAWQTCRAQFQQRALQHNNFRLQLTQQSIDNANALSRQVIAGNADFFRHQAERREFQAVSDKLRIDARHGYTTGSTDGGGGYSKTDAVNDILGGQETWSDGSKHGYANQMWTDGQGNYQPSNDPNYNPNVNSSSNWTQLQRKQLGQ